MKKRDNQFIDLHNKCIETGELPDRGLCNCVSERMTIEAIRVFELFIPTVEEEHTLFLEDKPEVFWGYGKPFGGSTTDERAHEYTSLRQTIVLLCHEILNS